MNVGNHLNAAWSVSQPEATQSVTAATHSASSKPSAMASDSAHVSQAASLVQQAMSMGDVRMSKVASIRAAVNAGSYHVDASVVADAMLSSMTGMRGNLPG